jgi:tocopherol O-methyltransferase
MNYESKVREFYDSAFDCYQQFMGDRWHHGDPEAEASGLSPLRACEVLEEKIVSLTGLKAGGRALDFGSGIGGPTLHMARVSSARFVGVTNNERLNRKAREKAAQLGLSHQVSFLTFGDTDYKHMPFADGSFDAVTFYESVCHVPDKAALFRELARVLKPGGRLGGMDWLQRPFGPYQTEEQILRLMQPVNEFTAIPGHGSVESYRKMIEDAGLQIIVARDLYEGIKSRGSTTPTEQEQWLGYEGAEGELFRKGKKALDEARDAGVFTVGMFVAAKRESQ